MLREQKEVEIKGTKYLLTQFGGVFGTEVLWKIQPVLLPVWVQLQKDVMDGKETAMLDFISNLSCKLPELPVPMIKDLIEKGATKGSMSISFDKDFAGKYFEMLSLLKEIIMFNYQDVFQELGFGETEA